MKTPDWYALILLALAAYRVWRLLAEDDLLDRPRRYVTRLGGKWKKDGDPIPKDYRSGLAAFINCPWCSGFWVALAWWGLWEAWPHGTLIAAAPWAVSTLLGLTNRAAG